MELEYPYALILDHVVSFPTLHKSIQDAKTYAETEGAKHALILDRHTHEVVWSTS